VEAGVVLDRWTVALRKGGTKIHLTGAMIAGSVSALLESVLADVKTQYGIFLRTVRFVYLVFSCNSKFDFLFAKRRGIVRRARSEIAHHP
jgi:hypothetical protein